MIGTVREDGTELRVEFSHKQHRNKAGESQLPIMFIKKHPPKKKRDTVAARAITYCYLMTGERKVPTLVAIGCAACVWADRNPNWSSKGFTKAEGRERSFKKMLAEALGNERITLAEAGRIRASYYNRGRKSAQPTNKQETSINGN